MLSCCRVKVVSAVGGKVAKKVSENPIFGYKGHQFNEDVCDGYQQVTDRYVLDDDNDDFVEFDGSVLDGSYQNGGVSYQR